MLDPTQHSMLVSDCGVTINLDIERYCQPPCRSERRFLKGLQGPLIDIGCGPGRAAAYLRGRGTPALGLDVSAGLVHLARTNGAWCVHQSVFDPVPFEGRWQHVLLLDGNIGIGGDPAKLLERVRQISQVGGRALIEVNAIGPTQQLIVREQVGQKLGQPFPWAVVSMAGLDALIPRSGWRCESVHQLEQRIVVQLERVA